MTGGGGYVGSSLCWKLVERGYSVTAFDLHCPEEDQTDSIHRIKVCLIHLLTHIIIKLPDCIRHCSSPSNTYLLILVSILIRVISVRRNH